MSTGTSQQAYIVRESSIHNKGVFAARVVEKGERIIEYKGEKISKKESERRALLHYDDSVRTGSGAVYLFILNKKHDVDGSMEWNLARLINHSCEPNCEAVIIRGKIWIVARRRIKEGEELSFDYGFDLDCWQDHPCRCGKQKCSGYIVGKQYWRKLRKLIAERDAVHAEIFASRPSKKKSAATAKKPAGKKTGKSAKAAK